MTTHQGIIILDFGSQYNQLIARKVRENNVFAEVLPYYTPLSEILSKNPKGIILSGGPSSVNAADAFVIDKAIFEANIPVLGICYGMQLITHLLGGTVEKGTKAEYGKAEFNVLKTNPILENYPETTQIWMSHFDEVKKLPEGFEINGMSDSCIAAISNVEKNIFGLQFHPEVSHTVYGTQIIQNFIFNSCNCETTWNTQHKIDEIISNIQAQVQDKNVILGLSGGVDSSVLAVLLQKAIGKQLTCIFVDTGLLRQNEVEKVMKTYHENFNIHIIVSDAKERFFNHLKNITDPEQKRKIIGHQFIEVFTEEATKLKDVRFLAQGTIYSDVIESNAVKGAKAETIKSHHNVGGLPAHLDFELVEPLREMFKDEVRAIGRTLGIPPEMVERHPFPGPGLAIRIMGEITPEKVEILQKADAIFIEELLKEKLYYQVSQAFAVLLSDRTVGVMGDTRTYQYTLALRSADSVDFMTATWSRLPYDFLDKVSSRIINEVAHINRVVYDISSKPPATIEWE